jgi:malate dehydrogenase
MVGATTAQCIANRDIANIVLIDKDGDMAAGKALDILETSPISNFHGVITAGDDAKLTKNSDVIVITAGLPRKPGMSREDLLEINGNIVREIVKKNVALSPQAIIIVVTNPVDALLYIAWQISGLPRTRLIGLSGVLDSTRLRSFIARHLQVSMQDVSAMVIGAHTEKHMVPLFRLANVNGVPLKELMDEATIIKLAERTKQAGAEIVSLLKVGSAYYTPAAAITEMVESILRDTKRVLPCSVCLDGEYGVRGCALCVPVILGNKGVEKIIELNLTPAESDQIKRGAESAKEIIKCMRI